MSLETLILAALAIPLIGSILILLTGSKPNLRETMTLATAALLFYCVASIFPAVMAGARPSVTLLEMLPGLTISFTVEPLGMIFAGIASFLWIVTTVYSIGYMRGHHEKNQTRFYFYFAISIASVIGIAFAGNMMTLFIFYEVLTLCTFPLVTHHGTEEAKKAGRVYLGILIGTSIGFQLFAIVWTWLLTGTLDFREGGILAGKVGETATLILLVLYVFGIGKAAVMPFHRWLPAAMVAPTPVSALLHAVAVVKAGVFTVLKVFVYIFGVDFLAAANTDWLVYLFGLTILVASIIAMRQDNLKRRLAYSTVSQLSYVLIGAAILAPISVMGAAIHIAAHAFGKITLFFAAGSILVASHKTEISQMDGIGRRMPWTMGAFAIGSLSMIGLPPTAGFISKWFILQGAVETQQFVAVAVIIMSTLLNAGYFLPIIYAAFFKPPPDDDGHAPHGEGPWLSVLALTLTAAGTVLFFFYPDLVFGLGQALVGSLR
ncbi:MAG: monovalent cation/H+ antiporter subunit D family protein [Proteobacteria bacterium]|nr:monovalent cation/H+ antiporter subunit D family protein [Pseudomonadota bacterium]